MPVRTLLPLDQHRVREHASNLAAIYGEAFGVSQDERAWFVESALLRHCRHEGFTGLLAFEGDVPAGFVYGYRSVPGRWWHDTVRPAIVDAGAGRWLDDAFEFVELAVAPAHQGRGIGADLHDAVLARAAGATALLSTAWGRTVARSMYDRRGWEVLVPVFRFYPDGDAAVLMGLDLERWRQRALRSGVPRL